MTPASKQVVKIPATIYSGVFDREYQVALTIEGKDVILTVSEDFVDFDAQPTDEGVEGFLKVDIVERDGDKFTIALPGEVQGASSRVTADRAMLRVA